MIAMPRDARDELDMPYEDLERIVIEIDAEMEREGIPVAQRSLLLRGRLSRKTGERTLYVSATVHAATQILGGLYPRKELAIESIYDGVFLFKGVIPGRAESNCPRSP